MSEIKIISQIHGGYFEDELNSYLREEWELQTINICSYMDETGCYKEFTAIIKKEIDHGNAKPMA